MTTIILLPLQSNLPKFGEASFLFIIFGVSMYYLVLFRPGVLGRMLPHPVILAGFAFVGIGLLMEFVHGSPGSLWQVRSYFMMFIGATLIASLSRDRQALRSGLYALMLAGVWVSGFLLLTVYGDLSSADSSNYLEATAVRGRTITESSLEDSWSTVAFFTAQGAVVALALGMTTKARLRHYVFLATGAFCAIATFLTMSRSGILVLVVAAAAVLYVHGIMRARVIKVAVIFGVVILLWVPEVVFNRLTITSERTPSRYVDGRRDVYNAVIENLPEYVLTGVGVNHFYGDWGMRTGFRIGRRAGVKGTHNIFAQVTVYWGLLALLALLVLVWQAYRCLPQRYSAEPLGLCLLGIAVSLMVYSMFMHNLEHKEFSITLGLLVGASHWIRPRGIVRRPWSGEQFRDD